VIRVAAFLNKDEPQGAHHAPPHSVTFDKGKMKSLQAIMVIILSLAVGTTAHAEGNEDLESRLHRIIIPRIEFRNANIADVFNFLHDAATATDPEKTSLSMIYNNAPPPPPQYRYETEDGEPFESRMSVTLNMGRMSMYEVLERVTAAIGITFRIKDNEIHFLTTDGRRIIRKAVEPENGGDA